MRVRQRCRSRSSTCIRDQKDSIIALSKQSPIEPIDGTSPESSALRVKAHDSRIQQQTCAKSADYRPTRTRCMVGGMSYQNPPPHPHDNTASRPVVKRLRRFGANWRMYLFILIGGLTFRYSLRWSFDWFESVGVFSPLLCAAAVGLVCGLALAYGVRFLAEWLVGFFHGVRSSHSPR